MKCSKDHEDGGAPTYQKARFNFLFKDFFSESSVHGLRYFIDYERHWLERVWWVAAFMLSFVMCVFAVKLIWIDWKHHPVTVTFDDKMTSIAMIPFPAITICSTQKLKQKIQFPKDHMLIAELFPGDLNKVDALSQTCLKGVPQSVGDNLFPNQSIFEAIEEISPEKKSLIFDAYWINNRTSFVDFEPIFTREGLCFTFNSIDSLEIYTDEITPDLITVSDVPTASDWNVEGGYQSNAKESELYPNRVFGTGFRNSLQITTKITPDHSFAVCKFFSPGFMLSLHTPNELPPISDNYIFIPAQQNVIISIKPKLITTSESLRSYAPHDRGCYFRYERRLRFFRSYSQRKCELECLANFTENSCGCVRFYAPRDDGTNVCRLNRQSSCCSNAEHNFMSNFMVDRCTCMPSCSSVTYDVETSQVQLYLSEEDRRRRENDIQSGSKIFSSVISISFKESHFMSVIRSETSTTSNFVANCGGLLGLFMGISMLSIVEIIYFFTLQLCCKIRRKRRAKIDAQYWVGRTVFKTTANEMHRRKSY